MATSILDAFIVTFGIDTKGQKTGEREIRDSNKRLREDSKSTFDQYERGAKKQGEALRSVANEAAGLFLVLAGAASFKSFAMNLIGGEAAAGRLSETIGVSTQKLWAWQEAVKQVGGNEGDARGALQRIATAIQSYKLTGTTGMDADLRGLGITNSDIMSKDPSEILLKMAEAGERLGKPEFAARLQRIGIPQSTIYLLEKGRGSLEGLLKTTEKQAGVTEKSVKAAQDFERAMATMSTAIKGVALPPLTSLLEGMSLFITDSQGVADGAFHIGDAFRVAGLNIAIYWDRMRLWTAERTGNAAQAKMWRDQLARDQKDKDDIFTQHSGGGASAGTGRDGTSGMTPAQQRAWDAVRSATDRTRASLGAVGGASGATDAHIRSYLQRSGFTGEQARGIWAGIRAEGGGVSATNPTSGAFGIGQWLGTRKSALFRQYGHAPTMDQQLAFLVSELRGGDHGGPAVGRQMSADYTLLAYITQFMRPGRGTLGDISRGRNYLARGGGGDVHINSLTIHTKATDAHGIARDIHGALRSRSAIPQVDGGVAP